MPREKPLPDFSPDFEASYREVFTTRDGYSLTPAQRAKAKKEAYTEWLEDLKADEIPEDPIADPADSPAEALEKIVSHSLKSMTPSDAIKHRSQLLRFAGDTVLQDRKAKIEKQSQASGLATIMELFRQAASGEGKRGPGWIDAVMLPALSMTEQAEAAVDVIEGLQIAPDPLSAQREAM
jgi:hypothetical protein